MSDLPASELVLKNLKRYLASTGWLQVEHPNKRILILQTQPNEIGEYASITLPNSSELRDSKTLMNDAVRLIALYKQTSIEKVSDCILRWDRDVLRSRFFKVHGHESSLPLGVAADAVSFLKEFLGYAAYTHVNPRPFFDKAGAISSEFSELCQFGHTFEGSFGLKIECPIEVPEVLPLEGFEPEVPLARQIFERVANGLTMLRQCINSESIDPLLAGYTTGFSANMCRKLAEVYECADGRRVEYDLSWSPQLESHCARNWVPMVFDGRAYEIARIAANELEKSEIFPDSMVQGRIVILKSEMPPGLDEQAEFDHVITMYWEREKGQTVKIRVPLSPREYIAACDAHKDGRPIRIYGVPEKAGKFWTLTRPHDFEVIK